MHYVTVTASELLQRNPKRFQKEYSKWTTYALDYDWWDYTEERFQEYLEKDGVHVDRIFFNLSYSQGDYAGFEGYIRVPDFMALNGYDVQYPALYLAAKDYGDHAKVSTKYGRGASRISWDAYLLGNTGPSGVFSGLDQEAWDELVEEQFDEARLEDEMQSYVDDQGRGLYRMLRDEYEYLTSEETFIESCELNGVTFEIETEGETNEASN